MSSHADEPTTAVRPRIRIVRLGLISLIPILIAAGVAWHYGVLPGTQSRMRENAIMVIAPYRHKGTWVFDDSAAGLVKEPFVAGVPEMIDVLVKDIPAADEGFRLTFSANPFPGHQKELTWLRGDGVGNYYSMEDPAMEGWICPAMFKYYAKPPKHLYVKAEPIQ